MTPTTQTPYVAIRTPILGNFPGGYVKSLLEMMDGQRCSWACVENKPVDIARNKLVEEVLGASQRPDYVLFLDSDMTFPDETVSRLLAAGRDVVSGTYFARTDTPIPHAYQYSHTDEDGIVWYRSMSQEFRAYIEAHPDHVKKPGTTTLAPVEESLIEVDAVGGGCLLIKTEVLEAIVASGQKPFECYATGGGEDFDFCEKARKLGYKVWVDWGLQCSHITVGATARFDFIDVFAYVQDFSQPILTEVGPAGVKRYRQTGSKIALEEK